MKNSFNEDENENNNNNKDNISKKTIKNNKDILKTYLEILIKNPLIKSELLKDEFKKKLSKSLEIKILKSNNIKRKSDLTPQSLLIIFNINYCLIIIYLKLISINYNNYAKNKFIY
jgi:hypothetical protein